MINILRNKTIKNTFWILFEKVFQMIGTFLIGIITARYLGPSNYGTLSYAAAYASFFTAFSTLGINSIVVKELVNNRDKEGKVLGTCMVLKSVSSFLSIIMIGCLTLIVDFAEPLTIVATILSSLGLIFNVLETIRYWFQSYLNSKYSTFAMLIGFTISIIYKLTLIFLKCDFYLFALSTSLDYFFVGVFLLLFYKKKHGAGLSFDWKYGKEILKNSLPFVLPSLMVSIYAQTDKFMLKHFVGNDETGFYTAAATLSSAWCFVLSAIIDSFNPSILEDYKNGNIEFFYVRNEFLYSIVFYLSLIVSILYFLLAKPLIIFLYGIEFEGSILPLKIVTWYTAFSYLGVARNSWIICNQKQNLIIWIYFPAAIINALLNVLFIPKFGAVGAAIASLICQISTVLLMPLFIKELRPNLRLIISGIFLKNRKKYLKIFK